MIGGQIRRAHRGGQCGSTRLGFGIRHKRSIVQFLRGRVGHLAGDKKQKHEVTFKRLLFVA